MERYFPKKIKVNQVTQIDFTDLYFYPEIGIDFQKSLEGKRKLPHHFHWHKIHHYSKGDHGNMDL